MRRFKKFIIYTFFIFLAIFGSVSAYLYFNQDKLVGQIITVINKNIKTPIKVAKVDLNWWTDFPNISLRFREVSIQESIQGSNLPLAKLEELALSFNIISLINGDYSFEKIILKKGEVTIRTTKSGAINYDILKKSENTQSDGVNFNLNHIEIQSVQINYVDEKLKQSYLQFAYQLNASLEKKQKTYEISARGKMLSKAIKIGELSYFENKEVEINTKLDYIQGPETVQIKPSKILLNKNTFEIAGLYKINESEMDLSVKGIDSDFATIISLLPDSYQKQLVNYQSSGKAEFSGTLKGQLTSTENPFINFDFQVQDASLFEPDYNTRFGSLSFTGNINNGSQRKFKTTTLKLQSIQGVLKEKPFNADLVIKDFDNYHISLSTDGSISTHDLFSLLPRKEKYTNLSGSIDFNISLSGYVEDFKKASTAHRISNSGELSLQNVSGIYQDYPLPVKNVNARLVFNKNDIAINQMQGNLGESDFKINGFFLNIFPYLLQEKQSLLIEAQTFSQNINLNEMLSGLSNEENSLEKQEESFKFSISPYIKFDLQSDIKNLAFKRFSASEIKGDIHVEDQVLKADRIRLKSNGGSMLLSGDVNANSQNEIKINAAATFKQINIDSIFYTFENFQQDFLTDRHLKGKIDAQVSTFILLDNNLNFKSDDFTATIDASISNGKLINFEPMLSLSDYVKEAALANLTFGELNNTIQIKNKIIYLPEMVIKSNISEILLQGTHTFDQHINYRLLVPLKNYKKEDSDAAFGAIEESDAYTKLHLKIIGTTDDFDVSWDGKRSLKSVADRLKSEGKTIKKIIKGEELPEKKDTELELNEEEYFDW